MSHSAKWATRHHTIKILEMHLDSYGHMNNAMYLTLLESARWEFLTNGGYGYAEIHHHQKGPIILDVHLSFKKEIRLREEITIQSQTLNYVGKVGTLHQLMLNAKGEVCAEATMKFGFFDLVTRRLIEPNPQWLQALGQE